MQRRFVCAHYRFADTVGGHEAALLKFSTEAKKLAVLDIELAP
jgi:hypothetical protein